MEKEVEEILKTETEIAGQLEEARKEAAKMKSAAENELNIAEKNLKTKHREQIRDQLALYREDLEKDNRLKAEEFEKNITTFDKLDKKHVEKVISQLSDKICRSEF